MVSARLRWTILLGTLAACVAAILYPLDEAAVTAPGRAAARYPPAAVQPKAETVQDAQGVGTAEAEAATDPFAPRGWTAAPVAAAPASVAPAAEPVAAQPEAPAGPPPLPFQFVGRMNDGELQTIYLSRGDQTIVAHAGDALDASYKVLGIAERRIDFEYTPTGATQSLALPAQDN